MKEEEQTFLYHMVEIVEDMECLEKFGTEAQQWKVDMSLNMEAQEWLLDFQAAGQVERFEKFGTEAQQWKVDMPLNMEAQEWLLDFQVAGQVEHLHNFLMDNRHGQLL